MTEYAVLGALLALTAASYEIRGLYGGRGYALLTGLLYVVSDEIHQTFVPGRAGQLRDVLIDTCGVIIGICLIDGFSRFKKYYQTSLKY